MQAKPKCKICRRVGEKLFLKGEKCFSQKCLFLRKPSPPGRPPKRRYSKISEYAKELKEVQKVKKTYLMGEKQFRKLIREVLEKKKKENVSELLMKRLEKKLFNVVYSAGLTNSRNTAKQLVSHGHFLLNDKKINIPSIEVKIGDKIKLRKKSKENNYFKEKISSIKEKNINSWLSFDKKKIEISIVSDPFLEEGMKVDIPLIISFYS